MISAADSASGGGLYSFSEAARYLHVNVRTLRSWFYDETECGPLLSGQIEKSVDDGGWLSFHDFLQAYAVNELKKANVKPKHVREAIIEARKHGLRYPLSTKDVFVWADKNGKVHIQPKSDPYPTELTGPSKGQRSLMEIIGKYLSKVRYNADGMAEQFVFFEQDYPSGEHKRVVMDPGSNFGEPTVEGTYYRARTLRDAVKAEGSISEVVRLYRVRESDVLVALAACEAQDAIQPIAA